ncbi:hypothetical protein C5C86_13560 [Rathayibacter sp. AY1E4]|jgi:hypothetical protein|uniref:hypothetical protein n=1 Tax=unclassified Rathayibacter TaxID=2609250 RepID=UPI000CE7F15E|nr:MULTISPECIES: hypothetical protein [unclassified Rathayibacter]PPF09989.1 hypothetical protein C5B98_14030 [Rathayibacter sp. AY1A5]PPF33081.1 hypothetical protein C5B93_14325 [Rathayibacter sp. AY1A2]PPG37115.1 hypothetical protein C5C30_13955 [Rathayibacter sp. AY2B5]PPH08216.1 hypothetical protein C5C71_13130 [Rathayibacter sp. AY1C1]PPH14427.1 hypothetical protein C5C35_14535 [Rathayibacter sp. AY1F8]
MHLKMDPRVTAQFALYDAQDPDLADAFDEIFDLLERDDPADPGHWRLRNKLIRPANAFVVTVRVRGRDQAYYLFWQPQDMQETAVVRFIGDGAADLS